MQRLYDLCIQHNTKDSDSLAALTVLPGLLAVNGIQHYRVLERGGRL
jgi:hypothetical protein